MNRPDDTRRIPTRLRELLATGGTALTALDAARARAAERRASLEMLAVPQNVARAAAHARRPAVRASSLAGTARSAAPVPTHLQGES